MVGEKWPRTGEVEGWEGEEEEEKWGEKGKVKEPESKGGGTLRLSLSCRKQSVTVTWTFCYSRFLSATPIRLPHLDSQHTHAHKQLPSPWQSRTHTHKNPVGMTVFHCSTDEMKQTTPGGLVKQYTSSFDSKLRDRFRSFCFWRNAHCNAKQI